MATRFRQLITTLQIIGIEQPSLKLFYEYSDAVKYAKQYLSNLNISDYKHLHNNEGELFTTDTIKIKINLKKIQLHENN